MKWNLASLLGAALVCLGILVPVAVIPVVFILPPQYRSQTRLFIPPSPKILLEGEAEIIQSQRILSNVISNLNLARTFAERHKVDQDLPPEVVLPLLKRQIEMKVYPNTGILETAVFSESRTEAADIANEISKVYLAGLALRGLDPSNPPQLLESASPALRPSRPNRLASTVNGLAVGFILILMGAWLIYTSWRRQRRPAQATPPPVPI